MKGFSLLFLSIIFSPFLAYGAELNAGFVQGLWYGSETIIANEPTRIYVALRNNTDTDLTGTVRFTDNGTRIGIAYVNALPGRIVEAWVDWTPRYGEHTVAAALSDVRVHTIGETPEIGEVGNTIAEDTVFVDYDTDGDGIPNERDTDDDDDGVSDEDENAQGTNPLKADPKKTEHGDEPIDEGEDENADEESVLERRDGENADDTSRNSSRDGLEKYVPYTAARNAVGSVTETINEKKADLDEYRENRSDALKEYFSNDKSPISNPDGGVATITRSQIETGETFFESAIRGGKALVSGFYSLILWMASSALAHPAILELLLLLFIVYIIYRTARRFGRRTRNPQR